MEVETVLKWLGGAIVACLASVFTLPLVVGLVSLIALFWFDFFSGSLASQAAGKPIDPAIAYDGKGGRGGWKRKIVEVILVLAVAVFQEMAEYLGNVDLQNVPTATALCAALAFVELLSIARNASILGVDGGLLRRFFGLPEVGSESPAEPKVG